MTASVDMMTAAEQYARMGFRVFPLQDEGKRPRIKAWPEKATSDFKQIREWWTQWPGANIGCVTGDGLFVVDEDNKNGKSGKDTRLEIENEHGAIPKDAVVVTPNGVHYWLETPTEINSAAESLGPGLDTKGEGGYVILPPSSTDEGEYRFATKFNRKRIPKAPRWLVERVQKRLSPNGQDRSGANGRLVANDGIESVILKRAIERVENGAGRNETGFEYLALQLRDNGVPIGVAMAAGHDYADAVSGLRDHPFERDEIEKSIEQAYRNGQAREPWSPSSSVGQNGGKPTFQNTDLGNAERLVHEYGDRLLFCHPWSSWLAFDGVRWKTDATGEVNRCAYDLVRTMQKEAVKIKDDDARTSAVKHAMRSQSASRLNSMVSLAESMVPVLPEDLDQDRYLLNVENGTIDLQTGELGPHRQDDLITKLAPVIYDPEARCPRWERHLLEVFNGDEDLVEYLQRNIGYAMTGDVSEQVVTILYGSGANGKGTTVNTIMHVLGDLAQSTRPELLLSKRSTGGPSPGEAALKGSRFVSTSETGNGQKFDEATVKRLTGGDRIRARFNRQDEFEFEPTHKLWLSTNHKPTIEGTDYAIWRRIHLVPFTVTFTEERRDKHLENKLQREASGILNWMVEGCLRWQQEGLGPPQAVQDATAVYKGEMDVLAAFLEDCCETGIEEMRVSVGRLYKKYQAWCERTGEKAESKRGFGLRMTERGFERTRDMHDRYYCGIGLRDRQQASSDENEDAPF